MAIFFVSLLVLLLLAAAVGTKCKSVQQTPSTKEPAVAEQHTADVFMPRKKRSRRRRRKNRR